MDAKSGPAKGRPSNQTTTTQPTGQVRQGAAYDAVTSRLAAQTGGTGRNGSWPCPAHDDSNPSLSVRQGNHGVLLTCHAGCSVEDVLDRLGLTKADLFDQPRADGSDIIATYDYPDETGALLFQVVRKAGKKFLQRRPDGAGGWVWKLGDTRRVVYRLPEVLAAVADGDTVFIVEGEKDADRLRAGGYVATCNPHGAGKWRAEYNATFTGAQVVIVADNDEPGRAHAHTVAEQLEGRAAHVRVVEPDHGKDISDHLAAGLSVGDLVEPDLEPDDGAAAIGAVPLGDWALDAPDGVPAVWGHGEDVLWAEGESLILAGPPGVGKTTVAVQVVLARVGLADEVLGLPVATTGRRVLYLAMDRPRQIQRAFARLARPEHREVMNALCVVRPGPPPRDLARHPELLASLANSAGADTVVLDSLKDAAIGLADDEVGAGLNRSMQIALAESIEVLALHHQRKSQNGTKPKSLEDLYGSTWIAAGAGSVVLLWGQPGDSEVDLVHLKQPAETVGPLKVEHDHAAGLSRVVAGFDLLGYLANQPRPVTTEAVAHARLGRPASDKELRATRSWLARREKKGVVVKIEGERSTGGGTPPALWALAEPHRAEP